MSAQGAGGWKSAGWLWLGVLALFSQAVHANELPELVEQVEPSVMRIDTDITVGSGALVDAKGLVITNFHVVAGAKTAEATIRSGKKLRVRGVRAWKPGADLALLQLDAPFDGIPVLPINAALPKKGTAVAAFGSPQRFQFSVSSGIVSAVRTGKEMAELMGPEYRLKGLAQSTSWVQTTSAISPGNSGGPLVNMDGELLAINTLAHSGGQNLNFAVSAQDVKKLMSEAGEVQPLSALPRKAHAIGTREVVWSLPSGRIFSMDTFQISLKELFYLQESRSNFAVIRYPSGKAYAYAFHVNGTPHGGTLAQYENYRPMTFVGYFKGKRHGLLLTWDEAGREVLKTQYVQGKRHGFCAFYDNGQFKMLIEYDRDRPTGIYLVAGKELTNRFESREDAEADDTARDLLEKLEQADKQINLNEIKFKKIVAEENRRFQSLLKR